MKIVTNRLTLTPISERDEADIHHLHSTEFVARTTSDGLVPSEVETKALVSDYKNEWLNHGFGSFVVHTHAKFTSEPQFVGRCGIHYAGLKDASGVEVAEMTTALLEEHTGNGLGPEAGIAALHFAFLKTTLNRVGVLTRLLNTVSLKSNLKRGFRYVGQIRCNKNVEMHFLEMTRLEFLEKISSRSFPFMPDIVE